ncbi:hypothetical protein KN815_39480 [Streptomyces sp. 4503]|uniref:BetI-type transcriptional repressor C-terminal domain-containing protein n=1 Tax=Streptomyces niphimycinicus TaxID=2842201 RepID=A0ABS6CT05_9ACTN|nr:hypothetical protein [Streptomyces niphimycinicus]MBU3869924.1 hypothetical protein [Streptomyces niphimycinicus]
MPVGTSQQMLEAGGEDASRDAGLVRADVDPDALGRALVACADGLTTQWFMDPTFDLVEHVREHFDLLMRSVVTEAD